MKSLDEIKRRAERATPKEWFAIVHSPKVVEVCDGGYKPIIHWAGFDSSPYPKVPNAEFIAHARQDVPRMVKVIEYLMKEADNSCGCEEFGNNHEDCIKRWESKVESILAGKEGG